MVKKGCVVFSLLWVVVGVLGVYFGGGSLGR